MTARRVVAVTIALLFGAACAANEPEPAVTRVGPGDDVQQVIDKANPGDLILLEEGEYPVELTIATAGVTVRGVDRNAVVLRGDGNQIAGVLVSADGVTVENLTTSGYQLGGVVVAGESAQGDEQLDGFRVAYVTAYNNEQYGIYSFQAGNGEIAHSYTSGHHDSGVYVGQCGDPDATGQPEGVAEDIDSEPCNVSVHDVVAEYNALGYSGTNASQVYITNSIFRHNRIGVTPNSQSMERRSPQTAATIAGNLVVANGDPAAPEQVSGGNGVGIAIGSGVANVVTKNYVAGHQRGGILIEPLDNFVPLNNRIEGNVLVDNKVDLGYWLIGGDTPTGGNCFVGNDFSSSHPADIETALPCSGASATVAVDPIPAVESPPSPDEVPAPPDQPTMAGDIEAIPAAPGFVIPDIEAIKVPSP